LPLIVGKRTNQEGRKVEGDEKKKKFHGISKKGGSRGLMGKKKSRHQKPESAITSVKEKRDIPLCRLRDLTVIRRQKYR